MGAQFRTKARVAACCLISALTVGAARSQQTSLDLSNKSLEDLMNIKVTSVSKKEEKLSRTAAAIFVITQEDIRRSQATNIPDLLRMVPGMDVAQINASSWAISARGMNQHYANKLLVMVDGRTVYTPIVAGVFWDVLDVPLEDIARIEVIRGPGGSVWGSNAVNGVINVITKKASETHGGMITSSYGTEDHGSGTAQFGGEAGKTVDYRVFAKYFNQDHLSGPSGVPGADGWHVLRGGFRLDDAASDKNGFTIQGDIYSGSEGNATNSFLAISPPTDVVQDVQVPISGGFLQGEWDRRFSARSDVTLSISFQQYQRQDHLREGRRTTDVDFQHHIAWGSRQDIVWGVDYRYSASHSNGDLTVTFTPPTSSPQLFSFFGQDEVALIPDRLYVTLGTKVERNTYTGFGAMPSIRSTWLLSKNQTIWAAVSRALRTPAENDNALQVRAGGFIGTGGLPVIVTILGSPKFQDETLLAYEGGYRAMVRSNLSLDFAAYYNSYGQLGTSEPSAPFFDPTPPPPHLVLPIVSGNLMHGETHGLEVFASWHISDWWNLSPGYAFEQIHMHLAPTSRDTTSVGANQGSSPAHSAQLRSHVDLSHGWSWDTTGYFVGRLKELGAPAYTGLDTSLSWEFCEGASVSIVGQNLAATPHIEFEDLSRDSISSLTKRSVYAKVAWHF